METGRVFRSVLSCLLATVVIGCGSDDATKQTTSETPPQMVPVSMAGVAGVAPTEAAVGVPVADSAALPTVAAIPDESSAFKGDGYCLMVGSFRLRANAESRARKLAEHGVRAEIVPAVIDGVAYHRVQVCDLISVADARRLGEHLRADLGIDYLVLKNQP